MSWREEVASAKDFKKKRKLPFSRMWKKRNLRFFYPEKKRKKTQKKTQKHNFSKNKKTQKHKKTQVAFFAPLPLDDLQMIRARFSMASEWRVLSSG